MDERFESKALHTAIKNRFENKTIDKFVNANPKVLCGNEKVLLVNPNILVLNSQVLFVNPKVLFAVKLNLGIYPERYSIRHVSVGRSQTE